MILFLRGSNRVVVVTPKSRMNFGIWDGLVSFGKLTNQSQVELDGVIVLFGVSATRSGVTPVSSLMASFNMCESTSPVVYWSFSKRPMRLGTLEIRYESH